MGPECILIWNILGFVGDSFSLELEKGDEGLLVFHLCSWKPQCKHY